MRTYSYEECDCCCHSNNSHENALPRYFLNAAGLIPAGMPDLSQGEFKRETTGVSSGYTRYFHGGLTEWGLHFQKAVLEFYMSSSIKNAFDRCAKVPICMDRTIETLNKNAMTQEHILTGAEIILSGRFFQNALAPVIAITKTLTDLQCGAFTGLSDFPKNPTFGDSWNIDIDDRAPFQEPDVVLKLRCREEDTIRLVGELKFNKIVNLRAAIDGYGKSNKLNGLLGMSSRNAMYSSNDNPTKSVQGQIVIYMASHRLRHGFISTYDETVFLHFDTDSKNGVLKPLIKFSDIILHSDSLDVDGSRISVRLGLLWQLHASCSPIEGDWRISEKLSQLITDLEWIQKDPAPHQPSMTPFGKGDQDSLLNNLDKLTLSEPDISLVSALSRMRIATTPNSASGPQWPSNTGSTTQIKSDDMEISPLVSRLKLGVSSQRARTLGRQSGLNDLLGTSRIMRLVASLPQALAECHARLGTVDLTHRIVVDINMKNRMMMTK